MFCQVGDTNSVTLATVGLVGQENGRSRTIAILHTTYRLTMRLVSAHISQWDVKFAGKWDSALKGNSALRAHAARAAGIELAHSEGQYVIHFLLGHAEVLWQHQSTSSDSAVGGQGLPARDIGHGFSGTQIVEMSPCWQRIQRHHHWLCIQHLGRLSPALFLGQRPFVRTGPSFGVRGSWIGLRRTHR